MLESVLSARKQSWPCPYFQLPLENRRCFTVSPQNVGTNHPTAPLSFFTAVPEGQGAPFGCALTSELLSKR